MRNIDSKFERMSQEGFAAPGTWIRMLRIIDVFPSFSAAC
jgi:hypothetical protein